MPCARTGWPCLSASVASPGPACECTSMKPGVTTRPAASMVSGRRRRAERADRLDAIAGDADIGADPRIAVAVDDMGVANQQVEPLRRLREGRRARQHCGETDDQDDKDVRRDMDCRGVFYRRDRRAHSRPHVGARRHQATGA